ncbi:transposase IS4 protein [Streptomyces azureus]|uniref:Transposase IS4 protein n=1 Tax=Streptomyces azureus TaxID=146537 RepID=A0A0K8PDK7_STRAJ|nr:transposase IS4 protein [Streptomyces azureus]
MRSPVGGVAGDVEADLEYELGTHERDVQRLSGAGEDGRRPLALLVSPGQWGDAPQLIPVMERVRVARLDGGRPRTRPDHLGGDKAYSFRRNRRYLRRRQINHTIPEPKNQRANRHRRGSKGGRPAGFDKTIYKRRNEVERMINALKNSGPWPRDSTSAPISSTAPSPWLRSAFCSSRDHLAFVTRSGRDDVVPDGRPARGRKDHESSTSGQGAQRAAADA